MIFLCFDDFIPHLFELYFDDFNVLIGPGQVAGSTSFDSVVTCVAPCIYLCPIGKPVVNSVNCLVLVR